jgi:hypothetical protein
MNMNGNRVFASRVFTAKEWDVPEPELATAVSRFVTAAEGMVAHWIEYAKGALLFVMAPEDSRSGAFYIYERNQGHFWLLEPADGTFGGYSLDEMREKIREFGLLEFARDPSRLTATNPS